MKRKSISSQTLRFLYGKSGNECAFPGCKEPIFEDNGLLTGECCHIEAFSKGGPRYNKNTSDEEKNKDANLVLMCARHQKIIDFNPIDYTTEKLQNIKRDHEKQYSHEARKLTEKMLFVLSVESNKYWANLHRIDEEDTIGLKRIMNVEKSIPELLKDIESTFAALEDIMSSLAEDDNSLTNTLMQFCSEYGIDISALDDIPYYNIPTMTYHWETHNLAIPNFTGHLKMHYLQLIVKIFEEFVFLQSPKYSTYLERYKKRLLEFHKANYYVD